MWTTGVAGMSATFIYIYATGAYGLEAVNTETLVFNALSIVGTIEIGTTQNIDINLFTGHFRIRLALEAL